MVSSVDLRISLIFMSILTILNQVFQSWLSSITNLSLMPFSQVVAEVHHDLNTQINNFEGKTHLNMYTLAIQGLCTSLLSFRALMFQLVLREHHRFLCCVCSPFGVFS